MPPAYNVTQTIVWPQGAHLTVNALIKVIEAGILCPSERSILNNAPHPNAQSVWFLVKRKKLPS
jgi:hypothetical protein